MIRMFARGLLNRSITTGTDGVVMGQSLPSGSRINNITAEMSFSQRLFLNSQTVVAYGLEAYIIPLVDPDTVLTFDAIWDRFVPKDTDVETLDLDTAASDATPFFEPGEVDFGQMLHVGFRPERVYRRNRILTMANGSIMSTQDHESPFGPNWIPGDSFTINIKKNYFIEQPSVLVIGVANPSFDDTQTAMGSSLTEEKWPQVKYIGHVLERAMLHVFGLVETGAETPWEEATALLKEILEPDVREETAGTFLATAWDVTCRSMVDFSVEGELGKVALTSGR